MNDCYYLKRLLNPCKLSKEYSLASFFPHFLFEFQSVNVFHLHTYFYSNLDKVKDILYKLRFSIYYVYY